MKYTIFGYQQEKLLDSDIDGIDLILLDYLLYQNINFTLENVIIDGERYMWINNDIILNDLPFLKLQERGLRNRIDNLVKYGYIERKSKFLNGNKKRTYTRLTSKVYNLLFNNNITNENVKIEEEEKCNKEEIPYKEIIDYLNEKANTHYQHTTKSTKSHINARWQEKFRLEHFKIVIDIKCNEWLGTDMEKYLRPETLFGTKFESYLNSNNNVKKRPNEYSPYGKENNFKDGYGDYGRKF